MVTSAGEVVLLDAGMACSLRAVTEQPAERWLFVAPELQAVDVGAAGLSDRQGVAADLYSLGALVHFLVTGRVPPVAPAAAPQARKARTTLADLPGVSSNLGAALRTLLSSEYEDRPESAAVLVDWLASGVDAARDRRHLIAEGLRAAESGPRIARESLPVLRCLAQARAATHQDAGASGWQGGWRARGQGTSVAAPSRRRGIAGQRGLGRGSGVVGVGAMAAWAAGLVENRLRTSEIGAQAIGQARRVDPRPRTPGRIRCNPGGAKSPKRRHPPWASRCWRAWPGI
jgi:hypothetical protein